MGYRGQHLEPAGAVGYLIISALRYVIILTCVLTGCASASTERSMVTYKENVADYNCSEIKTEMSYLKKMEHDLLEARDKHLLISDFGAAFLSLGMHAVPGNTKMGQRGTIDVQIGRIQLQKKHMEGLKNEKKC